MDHMNILKRAWRILWSYRALWIFGIILALTVGNPQATFGGGGGGGRDGGSGSNGQFDFDIPNPEAFNRMMEGVERFFQESTPDEAVRVVIPILISVICLAVLLSVLIRVVSYVSRAALIRMVDHYESTGEKLTFRQGWRLGWSRAAWRLFLIDLAIFFPVTVGFILLFGCAALPVMVSSFQNAEPAVPAVVGTIGMAFLVIFLAIVVGLLISLGMEIIRRAAVLENRGVFESIRRGWWLLRRNFKEVGLMWLILIGLGIAFTIVSLPVIFLLIALGGLTGGGIGAGLYFLVLQTGNQVAAWIVAIAIGLGLFVVILSLPLALLGGLKETYFSTIWTLTFRELPNKEALELEEPDETAE